MKAADYEHPQQQPHKPVCANGPDTERVVCIIYGKVDRQIRTTAHITQSFGHIWAVSRTYGSSSCASGSGLGRQRSIQGWVRWNIWHQLICSGVVRARGTSSPMARCKVEMASRRCWDGARALTVARRNRRSECYARL